MAVAVAVDEPFQTPRGLSRSTDGAVTISVWTNVKILAGTTDQDLRGIDLVVNPSETPDLKRRLEGRVRVIEFGNVLDAASVRMVRDVVRDLRATTSRGMSPQQRHSG